MKSVTYSLEGLALTEERQFFCEMLGYVSEQILSTRTNDGCVELQVTLDADDAAIRRKLDTLRDLATQGAATRPGGAETTVLLDRRDVPTRNSEPIFEELKRSESIVEVSPGLVAYAGVLLQLVEYFRRKTHECAVKVFAARPMSFPVLFPTEPFVRGGYLETFPHHLMLQSTLRNDVDVLNRYAEAKGPEREQLLKDVRPPQNVLKNAACGPVYAALQDRRIRPHDSPLVYYVVDRCFRNEATNVFELARLNEFTMSEIVFVGTEEETRNGVTKGKELWSFWIDVFDLNCAVETATDSFFATNHKKLKFFQQLGNSKQELRLRLPYSDSYLACSSVNFHRTHFTKRYNIMSEDPVAYCHSSCIAFGLERLSYALVAQNGCDPARWPEKMVREIERYVDLGSR